jgi:hypothetical protein
MPENAWLTLSSSVPDFELDDAILQSTLCRASDSHIQRYGRRENTAHTLCQEGSPYGRARVIIEIVLSHELGTRVDEFTPRTETKRKTSDDLPTAASPIDTSVTHPSTRVEP